MKKTKPKLTTEQFVERAKNTHGDCYDYSNTIVDGMSKKIIITCPNHGDFDQWPSDHLRGSGCRICSGNKKITTGEFIKRAKSIHGNKYDYSNVEYKNLKTKVNIICGDHGMFTQTPSDHLHGGYGCPTCGGTKKVTTDDFIQRAQDKHNNKYQYDNINLVNMHSKVNIECDIHGEFIQRAADHLNGSGCPKCSFEHSGVYNETYFKKNPTRKLSPATFYVVDGYIDKLEFCKIGITTETIKQRFSGKCEISDVLEIKTSLYNAWLLECVILRQLNDSRFRYQNLRSQNFVGWTECFSRKQKNEIIKLINQYQEIG